MRRGEDVLHFPVIHRQRLFRVKMKVLQAQGKSPHHAQCNLILTIDTPMLGIHMEVIQPRHNGRSASAWQLCVVQGMLKLASWLLPALLLQA